MRYIACIFERISLLNAYFISCSHSIQANYDLARQATAQGLVLLQNPRVLPFAHGAVAVIGPLAKAQGVLLGNYLGQICPGNNTGDYSCVQSPLDAISKANAGGQTTYAPVCRTQHCLGRV